MSNSYKKIVSVSFLLSSLLLSNFASAMPVDLTTWGSEIFGPLAGTGSSQIPNWQIQNSPQNDAVRQLADNSHNPSIFYSDVDMVGKRLSGQMSVGYNQPGFFDDDFIGFVIGYNIGDELNPSADFLLVDWKSQTSTESPGDPFGLSLVTGQAGMSVSRVEGIPTAAEYFSHSDLPPDPGAPFPGSVTELQRATTLGSTGWVTGQVYDFAIEYGPNNLQVFIDNVLEIDIAGTVNPGRIGFYSFSQADTRFSNIQVEQGVFNMDPDPPLPVPAPAPFGLVVLSLLWLMLSSVCRSR